MKKIKEKTATGPKWIDDHRITLLSLTAVIILAAAAALIFTAVAANDADNSEDNVLGAVDYVRIDVENYPAGALISYETSSNGGMTWTGLTPLTDGYIIVNGGLDLVYIVVDTPAGYTFEWESNPYFSQTATAFIFNPGTGETRIKGAYTPISQTVNLSITNPSWGSFTYILNGDGIIRSPIGNSFVVPYGSSAEITASPNTGYEFKWSDLAAGIYGKTITVTDTPTVVSGEFTRLNFDVYINAPPVEFAYAGGTAFGGDTISIPFGTVVTIEAVNVPVGYTFAWENDNPLIYTVVNGTNSTITFTVPAGPTAVKGTLTSIPQTVNLSITNPSWGSFTYILNGDGIIRSPIGNSFVVPHDSSVEITALPNIGYEFKWSDLATGIYSKTITVTDTPTIVSGEFTRLNFDVYINAPPVEFAYAGGTAFGGDTISVPFGTVVTIEAINIPVGYTFAWENGNPLIYTVVNGTNSTITFTVPAGPTAVKGTLTMMGYDVTIVITNSDDPGTAGGKIYVETTDDLGIVSWKEVPNGQILKIWHGTELKLKAVPAEGYEFECSLDAGTVYKWPGEYLMPLSLPVTSNGEIGVDFSLIRYDVLVRANIAALGSIEYWDTTASDWLPYPGSGLRLPHFTNLEIRIMAEEGYEFAGPFGGSAYTWEDGWVSFALSVTEDVSEEIMFSMMEFVLFIDVRNSPDCGTLMYSLTNSADTVRSLTGVTVPADGMISVRYFDTVIVTATPAHGYWMDWDVNGPRKVSSTVVRTDIPAESFSTDLGLFYLGGEFKRISVTVTLDVSGKGQIEYSLDSGATWEAFPEEGSIVLQFEDEISLRSVTGGYNSFRWDSVSLDEADYVMTDGVLTFRAGTDNVDMVGTFYDNGSRLLMIVCVMIIVILAVISLLVAWRMERKA